jgi:hypothetical protein
MLSVLVATGPVRMAVLDLFLAGRANGDDGHIEVELYARERMVRIDVHLAIFDSIHP